ncbi:MAG: hypothetical protein P9M03_04390 [Candidatus Theseobacter exili]|nr:hypothetical protein [Candidatus Theseobacter exili]
MTVELKKISLIDHYLHCSFEGQFGNLAKMIENTQRILKAYRETKCPNILLDFSRISGRIGIFAEHFLGKHIAHISPRKANIAVLAPLYLKGTASGHLENVVVNRATHLKVFWEIEDAVEWLKDC